MTFEVFGFQIREPDEFRRESKHNLRKSVVISSEPWKHRLKDDGKLKFRKNDLLRSYRTINVSDWKKSR
jgi:hypothetical protein